MTNRSKKKNKKYIRVLVCEHGVFVHFDSTPRESKVFTKEDLGYECLVSDPVVPKTGVKFAIVKPIDMAVEL
ncbi:MAG TPA: hypothetical protein PLV82_01985 [bacterium]|nr:hypothetical protein [bacterium]